MLAPFETKIQEFLEPIIKDIGYRLVLVELLRAGKRQILEITIDNFDDRPIGIEDCEKVSRHISVIMDVEDLIPDAYILQVSSPGIDRRLTSIEDLQNYSVHKIKITLKLPVGQRKKLVGYVKAINGKLISFLNESDQAHIEFSYDNIAKAKLVLTDELINAAKLK